MEHTTHTNNEEQAIDLSVLLRRMLRALRRLWPVCLALIVLCAAVMGWRAHRTFRPMYRSEAVFSVSLSFIGGTDVSSYSQYYNKSAAQQVTEYLPLSSVLRPDAGAAAPAAGDRLHQRQHLRLAHSGYQLLRPDGGKPRHPGCLRHPPGRHRRISPGEPPGAGRDAAGGEPRSPPCPMHRTTAIPGSAAPSRAHSWAWCWTWRS